MPPREPASIRSRPLRTLIVVETREMADVMQRQLDPARVVVEPFFGPLTAERFGATFVRYPSSGYLSEVKKTEQDVLNWVRGYVTTLLSPDCRNNFWYI